MAILSNAFLKWELDARSGAWRLESAADGAPHIESVRPGALYSWHHERRGRSWDGNLSGIEANWSGPTEVDSPHGRLQVLTVDVRTTDGLTFRAEFALPVEQPFFLWRLALHNDNAHSLRLTSLDLARAQLAFACQWNERSFFSNGYQSWSFAGTLGPRDRMPASIFGPLGDPKRLNLATVDHRGRGSFYSEMFGALGDRRHRRGIVAGFLSQREQFGVLTTRLGRQEQFLDMTAQCDDVPVPPGSERFTDWAYLQFVSLDEPDPLRGYLEAAARENEARVPTHTPVGWCSWYHYFDTVTEQHMLDNLGAIAQNRRRLPLDFVQLDDGFQAGVGDWFATNAKFPSGLPTLVRRIREQGQSPGLWLAPFMVRSDARLVRDHPDWFLRDARGKLINAGFNWFKWCYGLDPTHPDVREHTRSLLTAAVREWGFPYLKLDFLYAAALPGLRFDPTLTRAQAMRLALADIREAAGEETFILGCGCPLGSAIGLVDGMRISTDVAPDWDPYLWHSVFSPLLKREAEFVSTRNAVRNTIYRAPMHRRWWLNDPDCLLARDHDTRLTEAEVRSLSTVIALSGGMFLVSDDMRRMNRERERYIAPLMPVLGVSARAPGWMDSAMPDEMTLPLANATGAWVVAGVFNWEDRPAARVVERRSLGLDPGAEYHVSDFWEGRCWRLPADEPLTLPGLPAHGSHLLAFRRVGGSPTFVSSSLHFSQGGEVIQWRTEERSLRLRMELGREAEGDIRLWLPAPLLTVSADGQQVTAVSEGEGLYRIGLLIDGSVEVRMEW